MNTFFARNTARTLLAVALIVSLWLAFYRQGLLSWATLLLSTIGLFVMLISNTRRAWHVFAATMLLVMTSWLGAIYYVFSTWESGEVVDIRLSEHVSFRTWVVQSGSEDVVIYDCPPEHRTLVESSRSARLSRGVKQYTASMRAVPIAMASDELARIYALYEEKYADQSLATQVYYVLIGPKRGSQLYAIYFARE